LKEIPAVQHGTPLKQNTALLKKFCYGCVVSTETIHRDKKMFLSFHEFTYIIAGIELFKMGSPAAIQKLTII
jgi:hypothetical protein